MSEWKVGGKKKIEAILIANDSDGFCSEVKNDSGMIVAFSKVKNKQNFNG